MNTPETSHSSPATPTNLAGVFTQSTNVIDQIQRTLSCLGYAQLNHVRCTADGDMITLTGQLDSFYLKQVAQSVAVKISGTQNVRNEIQVV